MEGLGNALPKGMLLRWVGWKAALVRVGACGLEA